MDRALPSLPFEREPRSAGYPPSRHIRHSESSPVLPGPSPRYSDPGPTVPGPHPRTDFNRHYSVASTASTSSSVFGTSYSISSGKLPDDFANRPASSDERRPSRGDDGYLSPPVSRRTSEATKLPSIHELAKDLTSPEIPHPGPPLQKRDSLSTISSRNSSHRESLPFPPEYPGSTIAAISKPRSNSQPTMHSSTYPPPPFTSHVPHPYANDGHATPIARAIDLTRQMRRLMKDYEMIQDQSRHLYHFASQYKDMLTRDLAQGGEQFEIPSQDVLHDLGVRVDQITLRLRDISAYQSVVSPFQQPNYIKNEEDSRMRDVVPTSRGSFSNAFVSPGSVPASQYADPGSPTDMYWSSQSESGRSKYKKRSRAAPPGRCHSCNIEQTPEWRRGPDGARTLCNACGLRTIHLYLILTADYAKVTKRKERDQQSSPGPNQEAQNQMEENRT